MNGGAISHDCRLSVPTFFRHARDNLAEPLARQNAMKDIESITITIDRAVAASDK